MTSGDLLIYEITSTLHWSFYNKSYIYFYLIICTYVCIYVSLNRKKYVHGDLIWTFLYPYIHISLSKNKNLKKKVEKNKLKDSFLFFIHQHYRVHWTSWRAFCSVNLIKIFITILRWICRTTIARIKEKYRA